MKTTTAGRLWLGSLALLLAACGQGGPSSQRDPYAGGAVHTWEYTAPAAQPSPLSLTPGENTLSFEPIRAARNSWGPVEIDRSNGEQGAGDGRTLTLNGKTYPRGFGTHAGSDLRFGLAGTWASCTRFRADVGVDDEVGSWGSVVFQVYLDGSRVYDSGVMTGASATKRVDLDLTGRQELRLVVTDAGNGIAHDHADWASPTVSCRADGLRLTSAVGQYDPGRKTFGNFTRFVTRNGRSLPAYYDLTSTDSQGQAVPTVLCGGDGAVAVRRLSTDTTQPVRYRVEVQALGEHTLKVFAGDRCPAGGTPLLTQTVRGVGPQVVPLASGGFRSFALKADGTVVTWGVLSYDGLDFEFSGTPVVVEGLSNVVGLANDLALRADGTVVAWGDNVYGQPGGPPVVLRGLSDVVSIADEGFYSVALRVDGTVVSWIPERGQPPAAVSGLSDVVAVAGGGYHNLALRADGTVLAWGSNSDGQLGLSSRVSSSDTPVVVPRLTDVVDIAGGDAHSLALRSDGTVVAWGDNRHGQLGNGDLYGNRLVTVGGLTNVVAVAGGGSHSLTLKADGTVMAWGESISGQTGNGAPVGDNGNPYSGYSSPLPRPVAVSGLGGVVGIEGGGRSSLALGTDGKVTAWGNNHYGQLGDGTRVSRNVPVPTLVTGVARPTP